ncbi:dephospho-CoA kinase [Lysobacteraceae bacterium NML120232]|nr:dephospho-CoA kinase [Xanthomonadaceae bacterium NML08-0793]PJK12957.1 dephospho-CoA kinase [Xanthomonadaceae bacterium NML120232]
MTSPAGTMFAVGLTGGIASGKSAAEAVFVQLGITVVDADRVSRELVEPGQAALAEIVQHFGEQVLNEAGRLDRPALRQRIFANPAERTALEAILHPRIRAEVQRRCLAATSDYVIAAIPLLTEGGGRNAYPWLARILLVDVAPQTQLQRLMARDGIDVELAERMLAAQASRDARLAIADDVLRNEDSLARLQARVVQLDALYRRLKG